MPITCYTWFVPRPYTQEERKGQLRELQRLYIKEEKTIFEVAKILGVSYQTVFGRLQNFGIPSNSRFKQRQDVVIPQDYSSDLAEFFGVMLGDGHLTHFQVSVTLGTKELAYAEYLLDLIEKIFKVRPKIAFRKNGHKIVYLGSVAITKWLRDQGLVNNKVLAQVAAPKWIFEKTNFMERFLRGFFDTDGSVYKLRWGMQISLCNRSLPLLKSARDMLLYLGYSASQISIYNLYITKKIDVARFFKEISPKNPKHQLRFKNFNSRAVTQAVKRGTL